MRIAYLGPAGTFGEAAARQFAPDAEHLPEISHAAVATAVEEGRADLGVVAIENAINGSVADTLDILIHETELEIQSELVVTIEHNLVGAAGTDLATVEVLFAHPQALGQCRHWVEEHLPRAQPQAALSNAQSVELALDATVPSVAIATIRAAELQGAAILERSIQDKKQNVTRFVVLGHGRPTPTGRDRTSIAFEFAGDEPGMLAKVLAEFASRGLNCSKMESRPTQATFGEYIFLIDFDGHADEGAGREVLEVLRPMCAHLRVFGSYPRATTLGG